MHKLKDWKWKGESISFLRKKAFLVEIFSSVQLVYFENGRNKMQLRLGRNTALQIGYDS